MLASEEKAEVYNLAENWLRLALPSRFYLHKGFFTRKPFLFTFELKKGKLNEYEEK